jgi:hypothetical protein
MSRFRCRGNNVSTFHAPPSSTSAGDALACRRRVAWGVILAAGTLVPWIVAMLVARELLPGSIVLTNQIFAVALITTYVGVWAVAIVVSRNSRVMGLRAAATTLTMVAVLLILELPAGLKWVHWTIVFRSWLGEGVDYGTAYVLDKELGFRRIPNLRWTARPTSDIEQAYGLPRSLRHTITFTYDRWGYRNPTELQRADVVLIGDSYVEGWYVSDEQTVASRLAARLGRPVANLGVAGYGTMQELRVLQGDALRRSPRVVVWFFFEGNDLYDDQHFENTLLATAPRAEDGTPHPEGFARDHGWARRSFVLNAFRLIRRVSHPVVPNRAPYWALLSRPGESAERIYFFDYAGVPWTEFEEERWGKAKISFEKGIGLARDHGIALLLVYIPIKFRVYREVIQLPLGSPLHQWNAWAALPGKFSEFCAAASVACLNLTDPFQRAVRDGVAVYPLTDTHLSPEGNALAAEEIDARIRKLGWVP